MAEPRGRDTLRKRAMAALLERALSQGYLVAWIDTLGLYGRRPTHRTKAQVPPATRVAAAKVGLEVVLRGLPEAASAEGASLLAALQRMEADATPALAEEEPDADDTAVDSPTDPS